MNAVQYALQRIRQSGINKHILSLAYGSRFGYETFTHDTIESKMREEVFDGRILIDVNCVNTTQVTIPLMLCTRIDQGINFTSTWRVPKDLTEGKKITYVLHVTNASGYIGSSGTSARDTNGNAINNGTVASTSTSAGSMMTNANMMFGQSSSALAMNQAATSVSSIPVVSNALAYVVGDNTILIKDSIVQPSTMQLRVAVEQDIHLSNIQPPYFQAFYKLALSAVKAHIYNKLIIDQDTAFINSGGEMNKMRDIIESYADEEEKYEEQLELWFQSQLLNDPESQRRQYQIAVGGCF